MRFSKFSLVLTLGFMLTVLLVACSSNESSTEANGESSGDSGKEAKGEQVFNLTIGDTIPTMDASLATDEYAFQFLNSTKEGLYRLGKDAEIVDGIAKDHTVSEDALTWTFTLRENAKWSNGDPVTAHDFVYAWQRAVNPETGSEYGPYMMGGVIKNATAISEGEMPVEKLGVKAKDDYTLVVTLEKPIPYFESLTTFGTFYPLHEEFVKKQGSDYATSSETLLANGPFKITSWDSTSSSWKLKKNEDYWDAEAVSLDKIGYDVVSDPQVAVDLYEKGEIDRAGLTAELVDQYSTHEDFTITTESGVFFLKMNQTTTEALANENIRKAISRAINKQALVDEILNNGSIVANGLVPKNFVSMPKSGEDFRQVSGDLVTYDVEAAKEYWQKGLEEIGKEKVELELLAGDSATAKNMNVYIASQLESNLEGLKITLKQVPFEQRLELDSSMNYELQFSGWSPDYLDPYTYLNLWITDGGNNNMGYSNPKYDELLKKSATEYALDPVKRYNAFLKAEEVLFEDAAIVPLYQSARAQLISPKMEGVITNPFGATYEYKWAYVEKE